MNDLLYWFESDERSMSWFEKERSNMPDDIKSVKKWYKEGDDSYLISYTKHLERKIRSLEAEKQLIESEKIRLDREVRSIKSEFDRMRQPPLVTAIVDKILEEGKIQVKSSTGPRFIVKYSKDFTPKELTPGTRVALNQRTFSIVSVISGPEEVEYSAARDWLGVPHEIKILEVQTWKEITPNLKKYFVLRLKSLEQLKEVARVYRIPVIFKKDVEYLAIYYDTPLFWYKP